MSEELRHEIELLKAQVAALTDERLPNVDRASKRRDRRQVFGGFGMFVVALTVAGTLSASALAGSNTVTSDDIVDNGIYHTDIRDSTISGTDVRNDSLTGADIDESAIPGFKKVYFARVMFVYADGTESGPTGARLYGGNATSATLNESTLEYKVTFPVNVTACAPAVTSGTVPGLVPPEVVINPSSRPVPSTRINAATPNDVFVNYKQGSTNGLDNFSLVLVCP